MGGTCGTFKEGSADARFFPALPVGFLAGVLLAPALGVCCVVFEPFELSGGIDAFEDDNRR